MEPFSRRCRKVAAGGQRRAARFEYRRAAAFTDDGGLARVLELPETGWVRRYRVRAHGRSRGANSTNCAAASQSTACAMARSKPPIDREQGANVWLAFAIREAKIGKCATCSRSSGSR